MNLLGITAIHHKTTVKKTCFITSVFSSTFVIGGKKPCILACKLCVALHAMLQQINFSSVLEYNRWLYVTYCEIWSTKDKLANTCVITLLRISASMEMHSCQFWAHFYKPVNVFKKMPSTHTWYLQENLSTPYVHISTYTACHC